MKKYLLLVFIVFSSSIKVYGKESLWKYGLQLGPSFTSFTQVLPGESSTLAFNTYILNFHGSVFGEYIFYDALGLRCTLGYMGRGASYQYEYPESTIGADGETYTNYSSGLIKYQMHYCTSTTSLRYYIDPDKQLCVFAGPYISYLLAAKKSMDDSSFDATDKKLQKQLLSKNKLDDKDKFGMDTNKIDLGLVVGADYELDNGLGVGFEVDMGLRSTETNAQYTNRAWQANLFYNVAKLL